MKQKNEELCSSHEEKKGSDKKGTDEEMEEVALLLQLASTKFAAGECDKAWHYVHVAEEVYTQVYTQQESEEEEQFLQSVVSQAGVDTLLSEMDNMDLWDDSAGCGAVNYLWPSQLPGCRPLAHGAFPPPPPPPERWPSPPLHA